MIPFRFRLQRVLAWYEKRCRMEEERLQRIQSDIGQVDAASAAVRHSREATGRSISESASVSSADLAALAGYIAGSRRELGALEEKKRKLEGLLREQRTRVNTLRTKTRLLEKLRDRRLSEYTAEEQRELEELAADAFRSALHRSKSQWMTEPSQQ